MASQLASQLQKLQQRPVGDKRLSQSFLFDASEARSFSREQIHQLAVHGLQTLVAIDNRFHPFIEELFHPYKTRVERKLLSLEENRALDATLEQFLTLLSPHMFLTAAHQVFEYLVRVHEVHVHNVEAVLRTFLPYHDHSLFARAVMLLDLRDTGFAFLERNQEHGAPLLREHLILACAESRKALRIVCLTLAMSVRMKVHNSAANALFSGVAVRLASHPDAEALWRVLLPFIVEFLSGAVSGSEEGGAQQELRLQEDTQGGNAALLLPSREVVCSALVVLAAWSNEVQLSVPTLATVVKPIARFLTRAADHMVAASLSSSSSAVVAAVVPTSDLLAVLDLLFYTQRTAVTQVTFVPHVQLLLALPWKQWAPWITAAAEEAANAGGGMYDSLIAVLLRQCLQRLCVAHSLESVAPDVLHFVHCAVNDLPLTEELVAEVIEAMMACHVRYSASGNRDPEKTNKEEEEDEENTAAEAHGSRSKGDSVVTTWIRALERRFGHVFDATLSRLLNGVNTQAATTAFLAQHLSGTRYELLEVQGSSGRTERLPLFSCLLHPLPEVRLLAAKAMDSMTVQQLIKSSSAPGSGGGGNSLLELLEHVVQYEQFRIVAEQFLRTAATTMEKLLALLANGEAEELTVTMMAAPDRGFPRTEQDVIIQHLRNILRSLWLMATQHGVSVQKEFLGLALQPLWRFVEARRLKSSSGKRRKHESKSSSETDAFHDFIRGLALYYVTLQYVDAVHQESTGEFTNETSEERSDAARQLRELIVELERRLTAVVPEVCRTSDFYTVLAEGTATNAEKNEAASDVSNDEANGEEDGKKAVKRTEGPKQVTSSPTATGGVVKSGYLSVFECVPLLELLRAEAHAQLPAALSRLQGKAGQGEHRFSRESRSTMMECCLVCASHLATSEASEADAVIRMLLVFFVGENNTTTGSGTKTDDSYLARLREAQRAALRQVREQVGRGAKNSLLAPYLPKDELTAAMGTAVRCSLEARLRNDSCTCDGVAVWERMARLLGYLSTPLPAVALSPMRLPPVYLRLLEPTDAAREEERFQVDWFSLVYTSVFRTRGCVSATETQQFSLSALSLTLLCPLFAPTSRRESLLQEIQNIVLTATREKGDFSGANGATTTAAQISVELALRVEHISATTLSAIIESMACEETRRPLTRGAAELLCRMMASTCEKQKELEPIVPFCLSCRAVEHFFPLRGKAARGEGATSGIAMDILLPALKSILTTGGSISNTTTTTASSSNNNETAANDIPAAAVAVSSAAADFLHAAFLRAELGTPSSDGEDACLQLCLALIQHPFLHVVGGRARPVYRHALTAFANALSRGLEGRKSNPVLFIPQGRKGESSSTSIAPSRGGNKASNSEEKHAQHLAATVSHALLSNPASLNRLGGDATLLLAGTLGGYHRLFLPWVSRLLQQPSPELSVVVDVMEALAAPATEMTDAWEPPSWCALYNPLSYADVQRLLQLCGKVWDSSLGGKEGWCPRNKDALLALRLFCSLITVSPSVHFDDNDDDESSPSLFTVIDGMLETFPLSGLLPLLAEADDLGEPQFHRQVFVYIRSLVNLCVSSPQALNERQSHGAARITRTLVRECVTLMAALLVPDVAAAGDEEGGEGEEATTLSHHRIDVIAELLRVVSPLFVPAPSIPVSGPAGSRVAGRTALHIPVLALLIRLEAVDFASAHHRYESAMDVCSSLLEGFDVHTQLSCLTQMMHLLIDPHEQLSLAATRRNGEEEEEKEETAVIKIFRKFVKPNQVINRQEMILHLINTTVKSEAFLSGFLDLQHHQHASRSSHAKLDGEENEKEERTAVLTRSRTNDECMAMLVATLELFAHYAELNAATENDIMIPVSVNGAKKGTEMQEGLPEYGEKKAFTVLLELLAGNTLACVLAGINEATFVACLERLLTDQRAALQQKGLEVLLDRLHHALPTVENTLSESEVEEHRKRLRDPKQKLTLMDLVRVKARPLATKRSFALFLHLFSLMRASLDCASTHSAGVDYLHPLPLIVGCMEELVRIISSGGSLQAEKTLLNVHRANRVTEATLSKLFGNKARVQSVHRWVEEIVTVLPLILSRAGTGKPAERTVATGGDTFASSRKENALLAAAALLTALGTVCQVMGTAFTTPHSNNILQAVVEVAVFAVVRVAPVVSRSETGSLLRQASLGCLLRVFPSCWLMCQPYLSRIVFAATHLHNVDDTETNYRSAETLAMLEAVIEPHLFIEACTECLRGVTVDTDTNLGRRPIRVRVDSHSFFLFYTSVRRRVEGLKREELMHLHVLVDGATIKENFWLASLHALATAPSLPSGDIVQPVLEAYMAFFLKFKAKQCVRYLSTVAEWAFGGAAEHFLNCVEKQQQQKDEMEVEGDTRERDDTALVPRTTVHGWVLFYTLCNHMLEKLGSIMDFGFPVLLPYVVGTLTGYCSATQHAMQHAAGLIALTLEGALDCVRRMALAQTAGPDHDHSVPMDNYLETPEVFTSVMPAVVRQLSNLSYLADATHDYAFRAEHHVVPAVRALFQSLTSSKLQSRMQNELLKALRHPSRHVRRMTLLCLNGIYADGGDELAARLMAEMLPAVVEMTEDRDDDVVEQARILCNNLSAITGQDVLYAMSS
ncbi:hypothetical protein TcG_04726 [Trypanosoma cruzi]|nr:hypothetical protein TcG_04726 [Trypanosoma cruzi]